MGLRHFFTFVDKNLFSTIQHARFINLENKNVIIDGFSLLYFLYMEILKDEKKKPSAQHLRCIKFGYNVYARKVFDTLKSLTDKCRSVRVVFDGMFKRNVHLRFPPQRTKNVRFNGSDIPLPSLAYEEVMNILHHLEIQVHIAEGEADPVIVRMARDCDAYIIADDSDYHFYAVPCGYVPLTYFSFKTLQGRLYLMTDVFTGMDQTSVALWATTMAFNFIKVDDLEKILSEKTYKNEEKLHHELKSIKSKKETCRWLILQWKLCRYIQQMNKNEANNKLIELVSSEDQLLFNQAMQNFINASNITSIQTRNKNAIPHHLFSLYEKGKLDRAIIDIITTGNVLHRWKGTDLAHFHLLLPICHILLQKDCENIDEKLRCFYVTFNKNKYNPFEHVEIDSSLHLESFTGFNEKKRRDFVLGYINFALRPQPAIKWRGIRRDKRLYLSLLKLWYDTTETTKRIRKSILLAMIAAYHKHTFLDTYDEKQERILKNEQLSEKLLRYSNKRLKKCISLSECYEIRRSITNRSVYHLSNEDVRQALEEIEQFYKELTMVNQFSDQPFIMPSPHKCISDLTYYLAVGFAMLKNPSKIIPTLFNQNKILIKLTEEILTFVT